MSKTSLYGLVADLIHEKEREREREKQQLQRAQAELQMFEADQSHTGELSQDLQPLYDDIHQREGNIRSADQQIHHWEQQLAKFAGEGRRCLQQLHTLHTCANAHAIIRVMQLATCLRAQHPLMNE